MLRLALLQLDLTVGAVSANADRIVEACAEAARRDVDLVLAPELAISGYPPEDLLFRAAFLAACRREVESLAGRIDVPLLVGSPWLDGDRVLQLRLPARGRRDPRPLRQAAPAQLRRLRRGAHVRARPARARVRGRRRALRRHRLRGPVAVQRPGRSRGARRRDRDPEHLVVAVPRRQGARARGDAAHPGPRRAGDHRLLQPRRRPGRAGLRRPVGGRRRRRRHRGAGGRLRGGGAGLRGRPGARGLRPPARHAAAAREGAPGARAARDVRSARAAAAPRAAHRASRRPRPRPNLWAALCIGLRDYATKNGFSRVLLGLSGGIDSALVAALAADALGADQVDTISMPTRFNVSETRSDARRVGREPRRRLPRAADRGPAHARSRRPCPTPPASRPRTCRPASAA